MSAESRVCYRLAFALFVIGLLLMGVAIFSPGAISAAVAFWICAAVVGACGWAVEDQR